MVMDTDTPLIQQQKKKKKKDSDTTLICNGLAIDTAPWVQSVQLAQYENLAPAKPHTCHSMLTVACNLAQLHLAATAPSNQSKQSIFPFQHGISQTLTLAHPFPLSPLLIQSKLPLAAPPSCWSPPQAGRPSSRAAKPRCSSPRRA
jgi:hypothetical protein